MCLGMGGEARQQPREEGLGARRWLPPRSWLPACLGGVALCRVGWWGWVG